MHIAVCDDNFADRHQMERLLGRESDKENDSSRMFYVDSYGSPEVMLTHPKAYDLFFIDICRTNGLDTRQIVNSLKESGATAPFVLCCSDVNYREMDFPEDVLFLDKPVKLDELRAVIARAKKQKESVPDTIELRELMETIYANVSDVVYAKESGEDTMVHLTDGRDLRSIGKLWLFKRSLEDRHPEFIYSGSKMMVNCDHIVTVGFMGIAKTSDGLTIHLSPSAAKYIKENSGKDNE